MCNKKLCGSVVCVNTFLAEELQDFLNLVVVAREREGDLIYVALRVGRAGNEAPTLCGSDDSLSEHHALHLAVPLEVPCLCCCCRFAHLLF